MKMTGKIFLIVGVAMFIVSVIFVGYGLTHPEATFPFGNSKYMIYGTYVTIMIVAFVVSVILLTISKKRRNRNTYSN